MQKIEIYGTLGPSCCDEDIIKSMLELGMNGMRLNLSHCNLWDKKEWIDAFIKAKTSLKKEADLLIDMHGPELRIECLKEEIDLNENEIIELNDEYIPSRILKHLEKNDKLLIDDGKIKILVKEVYPSSFKGIVLTAGRLKNRKSIAIVGKSIEGDVLTKNDILNLKEASQYGVTGLMQPFVNDKKALLEVKKVLKELNLEHIKIYAKIENALGVHHLEEIIEECDCIVIARGDLGNAYGLSVLPVICHHIEEICHKKKKPYMVVTEMLNSMHENATPTRAEVSDIFHAVYNGASSIMLTGETAVGKYPIEAMKYFTQTAYLTLSLKDSTI